MPFLIGRVALFVVAALLVGVAVGWLFFGGQDAEVDEEAEEALRNVATLRDQAGAAEARLSQRDAELDAALGRIRKLSAEVDGRAAELSFPPVP